MFVLVHSPLVGPEMWWPAAEVLEARGEAARRPAGHFAMLVDPDQVVDDVLALAPS